MLDKASKSEAPFREILVWKFSRFTRKREHAVAFKSMLRKRGIRVTSITEHADDSPTGKLMEASSRAWTNSIAKSCPGGLAGDAGGGFPWLLGLHLCPLRVQEGAGPGRAKKRPKLELDPPADGVVRRIFGLALQGASPLNITKTLNNEGIGSPTGKRWQKTTIHRIFINETYTGTLVWGTKAKDNAPPVRVEQRLPRHRFSRGL